MMSSFWLAALVMLLVACVFVLVPFISYKKNVSKSEQASNWFFTREQELKKEFSVGKYSEQEYKDAVVELKLTAKSELSDAQLASITDAKNNELNNDDSLHSKYNNKLLIAATVILLLTVTSFYAYKGLYQQVDDWQQTLLKMPELSQKVIQNLDAQVSEIELKEFALGLRTKLANKEDHIGWMLLGRVLMSLQDVEGAISAFEKSYNMQRSNVSNTVSYAQALQLKGEDFEIKQSLTLLQEAMTFKPDNELAVILFGEGNLMLERFAVAKQGFDFALQLLDKNDTRVSAIQQRLTFINEQLNPAEIASIKVAVSTAIELQQKLTQFKYLFVFAKSDQMPMPIAVKKLPMGTMPISVALSDTDMMIPGQKLSDFKTVSVFARLSVDGNAPYEQGDWQGSLLNVSTSDHKKINKLVITEEYK